MQKTKWPGWSRALWPSALHSAFSLLCSPWLVSSQCYVGLLKQTACRWYLLQQQCQELITLWPICKHYIAHDTRTFNGIHTSTNQVFLIQLLLLSRTIWSGILLEEETYQVWRTQATPSVPWDKDMQRHHVQYRTIRWKSTRQNSLRHKTSTGSKPANE